MLKFQDKFYIFFKDISKIIEFRFSLKKKGKLIWGRSPYLDYGPGIRTRRLKKEIDNLSINSSFIYMQSHWPWYDIFFYTLLGKLFKVKIVFNQNGVFTKEYNKNYKFHNVILLFGLLNSNFIIYQSWFCYESILKICPKILKKALEEKKFCRLLNPSNKLREGQADFIQNKFKIIICKHFNKDIAYYSRYIYKLLNKIYHKKEISEIIIIGNIKKNLNENELKNLEKMQRLKILPLLKNDEILNFLNSGTIAVHLNYGDPCPNFVSEAVCSGVPIILNDIGGGKEIAMNASIALENEIVINGFLMPKLSNVIKGLEEVMLNYKMYQKYAVIRAEKLSLEKYVKDHVEILNKI